MVQIKIYFSRVIASVTFFVWAIFSDKAYAETGYEIAQQGQNVLFNYRFLKVHGEMTLLRGEKAIGQRELHFITYENPSPSDFDKARITVIRPMSLKGVKLLSWSTGTGEDQQWLYTPHTKRTRRIADSGRKASFVSSDFTFEDLLRRQLEAYRHTYIGTKQCQERLCKLVSAQPLKRYSNYSRQIVWYDNEYRIRKVEYFDKRNNLSKVLTHDRFVHVSGKTWKPQISEMENLRKKTKTVILWSNYQLSESSLERGFEPTFLRK